MDHQPASEDPGSRLETRRPVETTTGTVGSGNGSSVTPPKTKHRSVPFWQKHLGALDPEGGGGGEPLTGADCPYLDLINIGNEA